MTFYSIHIDRRKDKTEKPYSQEGRWDAAR